MSRHEPQGLIWFCLCVFLSLSKPWSPLTSITWLTDCNGKILICVLLKKQSSVSGMPSRCILGCTVPLRGWFAPQCSGEPPQQMWWSHALECVLWCDLRLERCVKRFLHWPHWYGFSPLCTTACRSRLQCLVKLRPHWAQAKGLSPVWLRRCSLSRPNRLKLFSQNEQLKSFWPNAGTLSTSSWVYPAPVIWSFAWICSGS